MISKNKIVTLISFVAAFLVIAVLVKTQNSFLINIDGKVAVLFGSIHFNFLDKAMLLITKLCDTHESLYIFIIFGMFLIVKRKKYSLYNLALAIILGISLSEIIKILIERTRPVSNLLIETGFSFPSNHATISTIFLLSSILLIVPLIKNNLLKNTFLIATMILFSLVALSRIYLQVHFASDVLAGVFLGIISYIISDIIISKYSLHNTEKSVINKVHDRN